MEEYLRAAIAEESAKKARTFPGISHRGTKGHQRVSGKSKSYDKEEEAAHP